FLDFELSLAGISPNTLSTRLKILEEAGLIQRRFYEQHPPRAQYLLTDKGPELGPVLRALRALGEKHTRRCARRAVQLASSRHPRGSSDVASCAPLVINFMLRDGNPGLRQGAMPVSGGGLRRRAGAAQGSRGASPRGHRQQRRSAPYRSGPFRDWQKIKTQAWLEANRERWRLFEPRSRPRQVRD